MTASAYNTALALYFVGYVIFEIPANVCQLNAYVLCRVLTPISFTDHVILLFCIIRSLTFRG